MDANEPESHRILIVDDLERIHEDFRKILVSSVAHANAGQKLVEEAAGVFGDLGIEPAAPTPTRAPPVIQFRVDSALQGHIALDMLKRSFNEGDPYEVAFVDMRMPPGWDGLYTIERLWDVDPDLQVVICTAYSDYSWSEISERVGQRDNLLVLKKPFDSIEVHQMATALAQKWVHNRDSNRRKANLQEKLSDSAQTLARLERRVHHQNCSLSSAVADLHRAARHIVDQIDSAADSSSDHHNGHIRQLQHQLADLVDYLRVAAGEDVIASKPIRVAEFVASVGREIQREMGGGRHDDPVDVEARANMPATIIGDPDRIARLIRAVAQDVRSRSGGGPVVVQLDCREVRDSQSRIRIVGATGEPLRDQHDANGMGLVELIAVLMLGDCDFTREATIVDISVGVERAVA